MAVNLIHKALCSTVFRHTTNHMMKLVPVLSDHLPSMEQDILCCTITKQAQCIAEFKYVSNPHIDLLEDPSVVLNNHSLHSIVLAYCHNQKKTFLSLDQDHSTGQVILTYPWKYQSADNCCAHHLVRYMEYENGTPALHWFNYAGIATVGERMDWNKEEEQPIPKSETELNAIAMMVFDWLACPDLTQADAVDWPAIVTIDFCLQHPLMQPTSPVAKLWPTTTCLPWPMHLLPVWLIWDATPPTSTVIQRSSKLVQVDVDANDFWLPW